MKKINDKREKQRIREEAMEQLRKTKAHLEQEHPALLKAMRLFVAKTGQGQAAKAEKETPAPVKRIKVKPGAAMAQKPVVAQPEARSNDDLVVIDREKNLETVLRYAAANPNMGKLKEQLKDLLN